MTQPPFPFPFEEDEQIEFAAEDVEFELRNEAESRAWLRTLIERMGFVPRSLNFVFCSDGYLHQLNVQYLGHDTLTDIITFPYADLPNVEGDIFISIDRVRDNARKFNASFEQELHRVMAHGVLHLCGLADKTPAEKRTMREKEEEALKMAGFAP
jgi:rRNA maturation RNase YbeY